MKNCVCMVLDALRPLYAFLMCETLWARALTRMLSGSLKSNVLFPPNISKLLWCLKRIWFHSMQLSPVTLQQGGFVCVLWECVGFLWVILLFSRNSVLKNSQKVSQSKNAYLFRLIGDQLRNKLAWIVCVCVAYNGLSRYEWMVGWMDGWILRLILPTIPSRP